jgi:hypothetical protein
MADAAWYDHLKLNKGALLHASYSNQDLLQNDNWWRKSSRIVHEYLECTAYGRYPLKGIVTKAGVTLFWISWITFVVKSLF